MPCKDKWRLKRFEGEECWLNMKTIETEKKETVLKMFESTSIRTSWNAEEEDYYFSVVDVIVALANTDRPRKYWSDLKRKLKSEGSELSEKIGQLKLRSSDGKFYNTDVLNTKGILRLIQSVPSPKAEPFKLWLAQVGSDRIDETFDPSKAIDRAILAYRARGYSDDWIEKRLKGRLHRFELTDTWKNGGIEDPSEYAILTNEIYKAWSGMKASEYKTFKGIRKESLRDNMSDLEVLLTDIGETTAKELAKEYKPYGLESNKQIAREGGDIANNTRLDIEKRLGRSIITSKNDSDRRYIDIN